MTHSKLPLATLAATALVFLTRSMPAADAGFTIYKNANGGLSSKVNAQLFAEYVVDQANKPYLGPVFGPTGKQMTRNYPMKDVESEKLAKQQDHPHHRGVCFGNQGMA